MAPNTVTEEVFITEENNLKKLVAPQADPRKYEIVWPNVVGFTYYHLAGLYGLYLVCTSAMWNTILLGCFTYCLNALGITAGVHRLWCHRSYKATMPLQIFLMLCHSLANQTNILHWARDHRIHHKYSDTDADPHNATRGFFYSHVGWLLVKKHPEVKKRGKLIDISDLYSNPVVMFQKRNEHWFILFAAFVVPTATAMFFWGESLTAAYHVNMLRYICALNATFLGNSAAHMWGYKPYDKHIAPTNNLPISIATMGEGFHNYHHAFPHDYKTAELGNNRWNFTTLFIDFCAVLGLAYDRRSVSNEVVEQRMKRTGDGTDLWGNNLDADKHY